MDNAERLKVLADSGKSVFSLENLRFLWESKPETTKILAKRMVDKSLLIRIARGYFSMSENFNPYELANLIISPSYVSMQSALLYHGISFQLSSIVTSVGLLNYTREAGGKTFRYYSMKESLFYQLDGVHYKGNLSMAAPERAIADCFYFGLLPSVDNREKINSFLLDKISSHYPKTVQRKINKFMVAS
jgi:predicted transcriptional regulator of viral defense system